METEVENLDLQTAFGVPRNLFRHTEVSSVLHGRELFNSVVTELPMGALSLGDWSKVSSIKKPIGFQAELKSTLMVPFFL
jgi:hypothetical protein